MNSTAHLSVSPEHQRRHTPDIIDVDALDSGEVIYVGSTQPSQRRRGGVDEREGPGEREIIHVTDSEDDNEIEIISHNPARRQAPPVRRERIFSPPPHPEIDVIPPVPRIPNRFLQLRPRHPGGLVIPSEDPFPFEADLQPASSAVQSVPMAAPSSHHRPSMGFGGALLAGVRRIMGPHDTQHQEGRNGWGVSGSFIVRWDPLDFAGGEEGSFLDEIRFEEDNPSAGRVRTRIELAFKQREHPAEPEYRPEYTHPDRPLPGFTHDFPPSSHDAGDDTATRSASGSGDQFEVTMTCAACCDPLVLGASDVGQDRAKRKLWGLRCGHLLDGKCIERLMEPALPTPDDIGSSSAGMAAEGPPSRTQDIVDPSANSMRSRLRPRRGVSASLSSTPHLSLDPSTGRRIVPAKLQANQRNSRKGKGKMKTPAVEAEHEWSCPVSGCGRVHFSLLVDGRWTMDEKRGAIMVFV